MTDIKDCCCCGKVYIKPKHKEYSLHSARHQFRCMTKHGFTELFTSYKRAEFWVNNWSNTIEGTSWKVKALDTGYYVVIKEGIK